MLFISNSGESLPIVWRLRQEGERADIYIHNPDYRGNYRGIIEPVSLAGLKKALKEHDIVVFDITRVNEQNRQDLALLKAFGLKRSLPTVFGPLGDVMKKDHVVIGASAQTEVWEMNRVEGAGVAKKIGLTLPESRKFKSLKDGAKFLAGRKDLWVFKPHNNQDLDLTYVEKYPGELAAKLTGEYAGRLDDKTEFLLQRRIDGIEISTEGWWDGKKWAHFNHTVEDKRLMTGNLGPAIGSQNNTVWIKSRKDGLLIKEFTRLGPLLGDYTGPIDVNCIVADGKVYFLEWTPRFGYDALYCLLTLIKGKLADFFRKRFAVSFGDGFASSARITIPPFPYGDRKLLDDFARDVPLEGAPDKMPWFWMEDVYKSPQGLRCAGSDGILGVVVGRGESIGASVGEVYRHIKKLKAGSYLQYRTDLGRRAENAVRSLEKAGWQIW